MIMMLTPTEESVCDVFNPLVPELNAWCDMQKTRIQNAGLICFHACIYKTKHISWNWSYEH
jgi:hypothetical protein